MFQVNREIAWKDLFLQRNECAGFIKDGVRKKPKAGESTGHHRNSLKNSKISKRGLSVTVQRRYGILGGNFFF